MTETPTTTRTSVSEPEAARARPVTDAEEQRPGVRRPRIAPRLLRILPSAVPGALILGIALIHAGRPTLSWDEVTSAEMASRSVPQILATVPNIDAVFGAYYLLLHWWTGVAGTSEMALRLPSIVAMAGSVAVAAELGRRLFTPLAGLVAGLILCIVPNTSRYAAEARPYAFACFFSVLALLLLFEAIRRGGAYRWVAYGLSVFLLGLFHLAALTTLLAHAALVHIQGGGLRGRRALVWGGTVLAALLPLAPVAWLGVHQQDDQLYWVKPITPQAVGGMPAGIVGSREVAWFLIGMVVLVSWRPLRRLVPVALLAFGPLAVLGAVSVLISPMWVPRYLLVVLAPLAILAAVGLTGGRDGWPRFTVLRVVTVLLMLAAVAVPGQRAVRTPTAKNGPDYRAISKIVGGAAQPGDVVVYQARNRALRAGVNHYLARQPVVPADPLVRVPSERTGRLTAEEYPDAGSRVDGAGRIWLVAGNSVDDPVKARPELRGLLAADYRRVGLWRPRWATVALYELRG
ncbi:glycosyltransferase family 39 protein [Actinoplanes sp. NPDC049802]|uniref:glycosyltransferase family 39 protein n=1 Tax=Actinoplanes sp. NPDC049802 TaxID=3154742 RepID=UPI0033FE29CD